MRIRPFDYWAATGLEEALDELDHHRENAKVIAGGTDLVLNMKKKNIQPRRIISLHNLDELDFVQPDDSGIANVTAKLRKLHKAVVTKEDIKSLEAAEAKEAEKRGLEEFKFSSNDEMLRAMGLIFSVQA